MGQGSFSANIHNPGLPCQKCSQRNVNEVRFESCGWGRLPVPDNMTHRSWYSGKLSIAVTYCSVWFSCVICRAWASQQGVAVSQLTRWRLTLFITCGTCQQLRSAPTWAGEEDDKGGGSDGRAEESRRGCCRVYFTSSKHLETDFPFLMSELTNTDRTEHNSPVTWDQRTPAQSGFVSGVLETYQNVQSSRPCCPKGRLVFKLHVLTPKVTFLPTIRIPHNLILWHLGNEHTLFLAES